MFKGDTKVANVNRNLPSHAGLGLGNENDIFQVDTTGDRYEIAANSFYALYPDLEPLTIHSLMDYDVCRPEAVDLQGTYCVRFIRADGDLDSVVLRVKKEIMPETAVLSAKIFEAVNEHCLGRDGMSVSDVRLFSGGDPVLNIDNHCVSATSFVVGEHIVEPPTHTEVQFMAYAVARFTNAMQALPPALKQELDDNFETNAGDFSVDALRGARYLRTEEGRRQALDLTKKFFAESEAQRIIDIASKYGDVLEQPDALDYVHGVMIDANFLMKRLADGMPKGVHIMDNETVTMSKFPKGYDAGTLMYRAILGKAEGVGAEDDHAYLKTFLEAYNSRADIPLSQDEFSAAVNAYNANALLSNYGKLASWDPDTVPPEAGIQRFGRFALDTDQRLEQANLLQSQQNVTSKPDQPHLDNT